MKRTALTLAFLAGCGTGPAVLILAFVPGCGAGPAALTALEVIAPSAIDAITDLVKERWGSDAEVDTDSLGCYRAPEACAEIVGDDYRDHVYACCRGKAVE